MNLQQVRYLTEVGRNDFNISKAAQTLGTSQPGISKQLRLLEEETQTPIFRREGKRLVGFTREGERIFNFAQRMAQDAGNILSVGREYNAPDRGLLTLATTPALACYALPSIVKQFRDDYPMIQMHVAVGEADHCVERVVDGEADFALVPTFASVPQEFVMLPAFEWARSVIMLPDSPLLRMPTITLADIAEFPIIALESKSASLKEHFREGGLNPEYTITTSNPEVMKRYVMLGLGVAMLATATYEAERDAPLCARDVSHIFPPSKIRVCISRTRYIRDYTFSFIKLIAPHLTKQSIHAELQPLRY